MAELRTPFPLTASRSEQILPALTSAQIARVLLSTAAPVQFTAARSWGNKGIGAVPLVVISGELEAVRPTGTTETLLLIVRAGQFTGEISTLSGRSAIGRIRVRQDGKIIQLARASSSP
jgi:hypothetical protein